MIELSGWGRYPRFSSQLLEPVNRSGTAAAMRDHPGLVARGCGRAYGDAAIGEQATLSTAYLNRILAFDTETGLMRAEAGVRLADVIEIALAHGYFPPVVPGTRYVTIGGMIASDVHGKNHHRDGGFGDHVVELTLLLPDGTTLHCSPADNQTLFFATIGGMGLTGTILEATFRLKPVETGWILQTTYAAPDLAAALDLLQRHADASYSVAWIDSLARGSALGRSLVFLGEHATRSEVAASGRNPDPPQERARLSVPIDCPQILLSSISVGLFNELYFRLGAGAARRERLVPWYSYFFPLDGIGRWNRLYGRRGFLQHQCVAPTDTAPALLTEVLERLSRFGNASFLSVLKQLGPAHGALSFPMPGFTLALDLPIREGVFELLDEIDRLVVRAGGRLYLAKDARQSPETFEAGYAGLDRFRALRRTIPAGNRVVSRLSQRLGI